jgi:hypothetical protein
VSELLRLEDEAALKARKTTEPSQRNWFMGEEIAYNVARQIVAEKMGVAE